MATKAGRVTEEERRQAMLHDRDRAPLERMGVDAATQIGFRAQAAAIRAVRRGESPWQAVVDVLTAARPLLADAMVASHLAGVKRTAATATKQAGVEPTPAILLRRQPLAHSPYQQAIDSMRARYDLSDDAMQHLQDVYGQQAGNILETTNKVLEAKLREKLLEATTAGSHVRDGVKAVREAFASAGMTPNNSFTVEAIFRTQTALAYSAGRFQADQDPAIQEILWGYKYVTVGDDRVRPEHVGFDGVTLPKDDPFWRTHYPPNGYCCRCSAINIFDDRKPVRPPKVIDVDGRDIRPAIDRGFAFNPGMVLPGRYKGRDANVNPGDSEVKYRGLRMRTIGPRDISEKRDLSEPEIDAVERYTDTWSGEFKELNKTFRAGQSLTDDQVQLAADLDAALRALPPYSGATFRILGFKTPEDAEAYVRARMPGNVTRPPEYISSSRKNDRFDFDRPQDNSVRIVIYGKRGRSVEHLSRTAWQKEVLYGRGSRFVVKDVRKSMMDGRTVWHMVFEEI